MVLFTRAIIAASFALWLLPGAAFADSYLVRCPNVAGEGGVFSLSRTQPSGEGCAGVTLPVDADAVLAVAPAPRALQGAPDPETITLSASRERDGFQLRDVSFAPASLTAPPPYLVPGSDLRSVASVRSFGPLGRATLDSDGDRSVLDCTSGTEPAGFAFATARVPPIPGMIVRVAHTADHDFRLVVVDPNDNSGKEPLLLATLQPADSDTEAQVPLTAALPADTPLDFEVLCPASGGHLALNDITLEAKSTVPASRASEIPDTRLWQEKPARIFARAQHWGLTRLYLRVPLDEHGLIDPQALAGFLTAATRSGIEVWALFTDRGADTAMLSRAPTALADYNAGVPPEAQIKGVEIEYAPDRLWTYAADPESAEQHFLDRLQPLKAALGMALAAAVPDWFATGPAAADRLAATLDGLTVITDRTDPDGIRQAVTRFLAWGTRRGKPVQVALETGPAAAVERARFARAGAGELWLVPVGGGTALVLLKESAANLPGAAFRREDAAAVPVERSSFGDRRAQLREMLDPLARTLGAWPGFAGFAFHGLFAETN